MGRQIGIALAGSDLEALFLAITSADSTIVPNITTNDVGTPVAVKDFLGDEAFYFALPNSIERQINIDHHGLDKYRVNISSSTVVEIWKPSSDSNNLYPGRLYYETTYYNGRETIKKSEDFNRWASSIFKSVRRSLKRDRASGLYLGREAARLLSANLVQLR